MKTIVSSTVLAFFFTVLLDGGPVFAQETEDRNLDRQRIINELVIPGYVEKLKLTKAQEQKFVPVMEELFSKRQTIREKAGAEGRENRRETFREMKKEMQAANKEAEKEMKTFLSKKQLKAFRDLEEKQREKMREKMGEKRRRSGRGPYQEITGKLSRSG